MDKEEFKITRLSMATLVMMSMMVLVGGIVILPALGSIRESYPDYDRSVIDLIIMIPPVVVAFSGFIFGMMACCKGKIKILLISAAVVCFSGLICYYLDDMRLILISRVILGIGLTGMTCSCLALTFDYCHAGIGKIVLGYNVAAVCVGSVLLTAITRYLVNECGWHSAFLIYSFLFIPLITGMLSMKEPPCKAGNDIPEHLSNANKKNVKRAFIAAFLSMVFVTVAFIVISDNLSSIAESGAVSLNIINMIVPIVLTVFIITCLGYNKLLNYVSRHWTIALGFLLFFTSYILYKEIEITTFTVSIIILFVVIGVGIILMALMDYMAENVIGLNTGIISGGLATFMNTGIAFAISLVSLSIIIYGSNDNALIFVTTLSAVVTVAVIIFNLYNDKKINISKDAEKD